MYSIGTIVALAADELGGLTSHLPWGWFSVLAVVDLGLVAVVVARRHQARPVTSWAERARRRPDTLVLRSGWWVPRSRVLGLSAQRVTYAWPLHREYMVRRVV